MQKRTSLISRAVARVREVAKTKPVRTGAKIAGAVAVVATAAIIYGRRRTA